MNESRIFSSLSNESWLETAQRMRSHDLQLIAAGTHSAPTSLLGAPVPIPRAAHADVTPRSDTADGQRVEKRSPFSRRPMAIAMNGEASQTTAAPAQSPGYRHPPVEDSVLAPDSAHALIHQTMVKTEQSLPDLEVDTQAQYTPPVQPESSDTSLTNFTAHVAPLPQLQGELTIMCDELQPPGTNEPPPRQTLRDVAAASTPPVPVAIPKRAAKQRPKDPSKRAQESETAEAGGTTPPPPPANEAEDHSSDERLLQVKEVSTLVGLSRSKIYELINPRHKRHDPSFPKPVHIAVRAARWRLSEVLAWIKAQRSTGKGTR